MFNKLKNSSKKWFIVITIFLFGCENSVEGDRKDPIPTNGLVLYYDFDDISERIIVDLSGNGNDATIVDDFETTDGYSQNALAFTGSGYAIRESPQNLPTGNAPRTLAFWVKFNEIAPAQIIGGYGSTQNCGNFQGGLDVSTGENISFFGWGDCNFESAAELTDLMDDRYHHIAYVHNGSSLSIYIDGAVVNNVSQELSTQASTLCIGGEVNGSTCVRLFNGNIDEFRIYNRSLTSGEIRTFLNN